MRNHSGHESGIVYRSPMLHDIPLVASTLQFVLGGVHPSVLRVIPEFGIVRGEGKRDVNRFFLDRRFLVQMIGEVNLFLCVVECDFQPNRWSVGSGRFHRDDCSERHLLCSQQATVAGDGRRQCRWFQRGAVAIQTVVRHVVGASHVKIRSETERARGIH